MVSCEFVPHPWLQRHRTVVRNSCFEGRTNGFDECSRLDAIVDDTSEMQSEVLEVEDLLRGLRTLRDL